MFKKRNRYICSYEILVFVKLYIPHHYYLLEDLPNPRNSEEARIDKDGLETARTGDLRKQCAF